MLQAEIGIGCYEKRDREKGAAMVATLGGNSEFSEVDVTNVKSLEAALTGAQILLFTFQHFFLSSLVPWI